VKITDRRIFHDVSENFIKISVSRIISEIQNQIYVLMKKHFIETPN